jgi:hypothetical protein
MSQVSFLYSLACLVVNIAGVLLVSTTRQEVNIAGVFSVSIDRGVAIGA